MLIVTNINESISFEFCVFNVSLSYGAHVLRKTCFNLMFSQSLPPTVKWVVNLRTRYILVNRKHSLAETKMVRKVFSDQIKKPMQRCLGHIGRSRHSRTTDRF